VQSTSCSIAPHLCVFPVFSIQVQTRTEAVLVASVDKLASLRHISVPNIRHQWSRRQTGVYSLIGCGSPVSCCSTHLLIQIKMQLTSTPMRVPMDTLDTKVVLLKILDTKTDLQDALNQIIYYDPREKTMISARPIV
jgi:hypothetical protein